MPAAQPVSVPGVAPSGPLTLAAAREWHTPDDARTGEGRAVGKAVELYAVPNNDNRVPNLVPNRVPNLVPNRVPNRAWAAR